ncbi:hypothetical protein N7G274_006532 [Stereocaulon virgatum]|uniref:Uncharacterized protein n=1 Tax=Stereocaulon virgatum TaxID=373712 RepID=A0ABR4AB25_9LECA
MRQNNTKNSHRDASTLSRLSQSYYPESMISESESANPGDQNRDIDQYTSGKSNLPVISRVAQQEQSSSATKEPFVTNYDEKTPPLPPRIKDDPVANKTHMLKPNIKPEVSNPYTSPAPTLRNQKRQCCQLCQVITLEYHLSGLLLIGTRRSDPPSRTDAAIEQGRTCLFSYGLADYYCSYI